MAESSCSEDDMIKANESNPFFSKDRSNFLSTVERYVKETKVNDLQLNFLGFKGPEVKTILQFLARSHSKVTQLNLASNHFEGGMDGVFEMLVKTKLKKFEISCSKVRTDGFMQLMKVLKDTKITDLGVGDCLIELDMYGASKFTSYLLLSHLTHLNLAFSKFVPATGALTFIDALRYTSITCLSLEQCQLHNDVIMALFSNIHRTKIIDLNVAMNEITDEQIKELGPNLRASKLEKLYFSFNNISDVGVDYLAAGLVNSSVTHLDISENIFEGSNSLGECLKFTKIEELVFTENGIVDSKMFAFPSFLKDTSVHSLNLAYCSLGDEIGQKLMHSLKFSNVTSLYVQGNKLGSLSLSEFAKNVNDLKLTFADFSDNELPLSDFVLFTDSLKSSKLESVNFRDNFFPPLGSEAIPFLLLKMKGTNITTIDVGLNEIFKQGAETIANILADTDFTINDLDLQCNDIEDGIMKLAAQLKFSSLTRLNLCGNNIKDSGLETVAKVLKETQIVELNVSENLITNQGASALARGLKGSHILYLNLRKNKIGNKGLQALSKHIKNTFITFLDLSRNPGNRKYLVETVLYENRISEHHLVSFFKKIAPAGGEVSFRFDYIIDHFNGGSFLEDLLLFYKTLEQPIALSVLAERGGLSFSKSRIADLIEAFPREFSVFVASNIRGNVSQHISILKRAEELKLSKIVESLLFNRPIYTVDESRGILHPYVYKLLFSYKQPLYNLSVEPQSKMNIINYFTDHTEYSDASDVVKMLLTQ